MNLSSAPMEGIITGTCVDRFRYAGGYTLGGCFTINLLYKPIWLHRVLMRMCLGFVWQDSKQEKP